MRSTTTRHGRRATKQRGTGRWRVVAVTILVGSLVAGCGSSGSDDSDVPTGPPPALEESREFRAIAGVSMGGYGALNLGTKHSNLFGTIASLGGPVSMGQLLRDSIEDNLEIKTQTTLPREVGEDFTFDHLPPYPERDSRIMMFQDLSIAFGNPFLHHTDPDRQYLARDSEPAARLVDDAYGTFTIPANARGFIDGGDANEDGLRQLDETPLVATDVMLVAGGSLAALAPGATRLERGGRELADLDNDGIFDVGDGLVVNYSEPLPIRTATSCSSPTSARPSTMLVSTACQEAETSGEERHLDYDPDRARWFSEDPLTRLEGLSADTIRTLRIYMDVGTEDELGFAQHYADLVDVLVAKGLAVAIQDGFDGNCADLPGPNNQFLLVRYPAGHVGFESVDPDDLLNGDICGTGTVWQRIISMIGFLNESFPGGVFGPGAGNAPDIDIDLPGLDIDFEPPNLDPTGDIVTGALPSPALRNGAATPMRDIVVYRPPAFFRSDASFPIVYFLGGYGQDPEDFEQGRLLLDALILTGQLQNMYMAFLPGAGGREGSFYVNHTIPEDQVPEIDEVTSGRFEDSILEDLIPVIENEILDRRIRRS